MASPPSCSGPDPARSADALRESWRGETAERYARERFGSRRHARRDANLVERCLRRFRVPEGGVVLDTPCGTGRLRSVLERGRRYVGLDVSADMLAAGDAGSTPVEGDAFHLPFREGAVPLVVCCRLLHHLDDVAPVVRELVRVASGHVLASYWDRASWQALRNGRRPHDRRRARRSAEVREAFERAGARVLGFEHTFRFVSQQSWVVARVGG